MKNPLIILVSIGFATSAIATESVWREDTFEDFVDGTFGDGGANTYVSAKGRVQTVNRWDVNGDGFIDIAVSNSHGLSEALDLSIYWGNGRDFDIRRQSYIPSNGSQWSVPADLDGDGHMDLVAANYSNGTWTDMDSFVFYGGLEDRNHVPLEGEWGFFPFERRIELPTQSAQNAAVGDLNRDGHLDIVFAFSVGFSEYRNQDQEYTSPSRIYWGSADGFSSDNHSDLPAMGASDVAIADLNDDGWLEVLFANASRESEFAFKAETDIDSYVYWGGPNGFSSDRRTELPTHKAASVETGDVDGDKVPDIVFVNEGSETSFAYLNKDGGFTPKNRIEFETHAAKDCAIEDFNKDGFPDVFFTNHVFHGNRMTDSYLYYGSKEGFSDENRQSLPTIGAWGVSSGDLNADGWVDLFVSNYQESHSYEVPSFLYWNSPDGFQKMMRTPLLEHGASGNAIADLDGDGHLDILVNSMAAYSRGDTDTNFVYLGDQEGNYSPDRRLEFKGAESYEFAIADLDDDGFVEIAYGNAGESGRLANENTVHWNIDNTFHPWRVTALAGYLTLGIQTADLDRDGWLDLIVCNFASDRETGAVESYIYWGAADGFTATERTVINHVSRSCCIADLNGDGHLDLTFASPMKVWAPEHRPSALIFWGDGTRAYGHENVTFLPETAGTSQPEIADLNKDGFLDIVFPRRTVTTEAIVIYGSADGDWENALRDRLPLETCSNSTIADVNQDGWLDLVFPVYKTKGPPISRGTESKVWLGSSEGFSDDRVLRLPTNSGTGSLVSDFNRDGYNDIFLYGHRREASYDKIGDFGDHTTHSYLYWGGPDGFSPNNRLSVPTVGAHNDAGVDLGHIWDRTFEFDYLSSPFELEGRQPVRLDWFAQEPWNSSVRFQLRTANTPEELANAPWLGEEGEGSAYETSGTSLTLPKGEWLQYRAILDTENGGYSPILESVEIAFRN
jgi:hypothetical protein